MIICKWCGKMIKKNQPRVSLGKPFYDHEECNKETNKHIKEKYGYDMAPNEGQQKLI